MKFRAFDWQHVLLYTGIPVTAIALCARGIAYANPGWPVLTLMLVVSGTFAGIGAWMMRLRWLWQKSITFYAADMAVRMQQSHVSADGNVQISKAISDSRSWWTDFRRVTSDDGLKIYRAFAATTLSFVDDLIAEPMTNRLVRGLTDYDKVAIVWRDSDSLEDVLSLIRHELGHVALNAIGFNPDEEAQHTEMKRLGWS